MKIILNGFKKLYNELVFSFHLKFHKTKLKIIKIKVLRSLITLLLQVDKNQENLQVIIVKIITIDKIEILDLEEALKNIITITMNGRD